MEGWGGGRCKIKRGGLLLVDLFLSLHLDGVHLMSRPYKMALRRSIKPGPHAAMPYTCDGVFPLCCDARKSHAMCCDRKFNMLNILVLILEYFGYLQSDFQTVFSILMEI